MPWTYESSKDGLIVTGIPDSLTVDSPEFDQILAARRAQRDAAKAPQAEAPSVLDRVSEVASDIGAGVMRGLAPVASGAGLGALVGSPGGPVGAGIGAMTGAATMTGATMLGDPLANVINAVAGREIVTPPTEAINSILDQAGLPRPGTAAGRVAQGAASGVGSAAGLVGVGKILQQGASPIVQRVGADLAAQPAAQIAGGFGSGAGAQAASEAGGGMAAQLAAGLVGGATGAGLQSLAAPRVTAGASDIAARAAAIRGAEENRIPVTTSDIIQNPTFAGKWLSEFGERIPIVGTGGLRARQQGSRVQAVKDFAQQYGATGRYMDELTPVAQSFAAKRGADLGKYSAMKAEIAERLAPAGAVPVERTIGEIDKQIADLSKLKLAELAPVVARLQGWREAVQGQDIKSMEIIRKQIGESFSDPSLASVRGYGEKVLSAIYAPLREDLRDFVKANGGAKDATKWEVANANLSKMAGDLDKDALRYALRKAESDPEAVGSLLFSSRPSDVQALFKELPPQGRALARRAIVSKAVQAAGGLDGLVALSPDKFANEVKRLSASTGVAFGGEDVQRLTGLVRALEITKRAGQAGQAPPTGIQNQLPIVTGAIGSLIGQGPATVAGLIGYGGLARLYESKPMRDAVISLARTKRGGKEEAAAFRRVAMAISAANSAEMNKSKEQK